MGGILQVDTIQNNNATTLITQTNSTTLTFGVSGQNIVIPSGVTFNTASATVNYPAGSITDATINASAAIAYSKLNLSNSIVNADIASAAAIATSKLGAGAVLQVVSTASTTNLNTTSTSFVAVTDLSLSITPLFTSSKIYVVAHTRLRVQNGNCYLTFFRGATNLGGTDGLTWIYGADVYTGLAMNYLDSPSTTSATTYQVYTRVDSVSTTGNIAGSNTKAVITAFEIAG